jgi:hypothetical protein
MSTQVEYGVFMPVGEGGWIRSITAPPVPATYAYNRQVAILAEQLGLDFLLAMAKWRGFGGASNHWNTTLESMTVMAALAEVTTRVRLMPTVHTLAFNVALVAKMIATLDQIAPGRAGLNIVSGWYREELGQMGLWPEHISHAERYEVAREWVQTLKRLWQEERVTFHGHYVQLEDCISTVPWHGGSPSPSQGLVSPRPRGDRGGATSSYRLSASLVLPRASHEGASHSRPSPVMEATRERQMPSWPVSHGCLGNPRSACVRVGTQPSAGAGRVADTGSSDRETPKVCHPAPAVRSSAPART